MECQSVAGLGAAPAGVTTADISALLPESVGQGSLVTEDHREVSPLSRGVVSLALHPYPDHYRPAFAFSLILYPPPHRLALRLAVPCGRTTGLPRCTDVPKVGKVAALRRWYDICAGGSLEPPDLTTHLLVQACQHLWLVLG